MINVWKLSQPKEPWRLMWKWYTRGINHSHVIFVPEVSTEKQIWTDISWFTVAKNLLRYIVKSYAFLQFYKLAFFVNFIHNCSIDFKLWMMITSTVRYNLESLVILNSLPESLYMQSWNFLNYMVENLNLNVIKTIKQKKICSSLNLSLNAFRATTPLNFSLWNFLFTLFLPLYLRRGSL